MALDATVGGANAESYVTVAEADTYHSARGNTTWTGTDAAKEAALRRATSYIDGTYRGRWKGTRADADQALAWPRTSVLDEDGFAVSTTIIPTAVKRATYEAALRELVDPGSLSPDLARGGDIKREKVGPIEVEYSATASIGTTITAIEDYLSGLIDGGGENTVYLGRA